MFKRKWVIVSVFVVLLLVAIGWGWFSGGSSGQVEVVGDLAEKDVKEIKEVVQGRNRRVLVEDVWRIIWRGDFKMIPRSIREDEKLLQMTRIEVRTNGEVYVHMFFDAYVLNHTNTWRIVKRISRVD